MRFRTIAMVVSALGMPGVIFYKRGHRSAVPVVFVMKRDPQTVTHVDGNAHILTDIILARKGDRLGLNTEVHRRVDPVDTWAL